MSDLDEKLRMIMQNHLAPPDELDQAVVQIKQAFTDAGYITPEQRDKAMEMVNQMVNLANDAFHMPTIQYIKPNKAMTKAQNLMSSRHFYERFRRELDKYDRVELETKGGPADFIHLDTVMEAARRAAGINETKEQQ